MGLGGGFGLTSMAMSDPFQLSRPKPIDPTSPRAPEGWVWVAGVAILAMGSFGLYRGITDARTGQSGLIPSVHGGVVAPVDATAANALPHDDQWSTLSGPKVLPPAPPKPVKQADSNASGAPNAQSAAAADQADDQNTDTGADDMPQPVVTKTPAAKPAKPASRPTTPSPDSGTPPPEPDGQ